MTDQTQAARIIGVFGGRTAMVRDTPYTYAQVRRWDELGFVPSEEHQRVLDLAISLGHSLSAADFIAHLAAGADRDTQSAAA